MLLGLMLMYYRLRIFVQCQHSILVLIQVPAPPLQFSSLLIHLKKQWRKSQVLGPYTHMRNLEESPTSWLLSTYIRVEGRGREERGVSLSSSLCNSASQIKGM